MSPYNSRRIQFRFSKNSIRINFEKESNVETEKYFEHSCSCISVCRSGFRKFPNIFVYVAQLAANKSKHSNDPKVSFEIFTTFITYVQHMPISTSEAVPSNRNPQRIEQKYEKGESRRIFIFECDNQSQTHLVTQAFKSKFEMNTSIYSEKCPEIS